MGRFLGDEENISKSLEFVDDSEKYLYFVVVGFTIIENISKYDVGFVQNLGKGRGKDKNFVDGKIYKICTRFGRF